MPANRGLDGPHAVSEVIAAKDRNNLYLTSCYFVDPERYRAFCALYAVMRVVDDRVDDLAINGQLSNAQLEIEHQVLAAWREAFFCAVRGETLSTEILVRCDFPQSGELLQAAAVAMEKFPIPHLIWQNFFDAMERDIERPDFETWEEFLDYCEGATVAPTTIYLYLIASAPSNTGVYLPPEDFDILECGRALGIFAYIGHILRDLDLDLAVGSDGLLYLAKDDLARFGVSRETLLEDLGNKATSAPAIALAKELADRAWRFRDAGRKLTLSAAGKLEPDCAFILELIVTIYEETLVKIAAGSHDLLAGRHRLSMDEKTRITKEVAERVGLSSMSAIPAG